jgi:hypothetical protein
MSDERLFGFVLQVRDDLLRWKREATDRDTRVRISEMLERFDELERADSQFTDWCRKHAPQWATYDDGEKCLILRFLANGSDGVSREEAAAILGCEQEDESRAGASNGALRTRVWRLQKDFRESGSTVKIFSLGGVYRTTDPVIVTLGDVSPVRDR